MANFFDAGNVPDLRLLHPEVRDMDRSEIYDMVDKVEFEIIQAFSQRDMQGLSTYESFFEYEKGSPPTDKIKVRLMGYDKEDPKSSDEGLKAVFRQTIANVVSYLMRNQSNQNNVSSIRQGQRAVNYIGNVNAGDFPSGWDRLFKNYDARIQPYGI